MFTRNNEICRPWILLHNVLNSAVPTSSSLSPWRWLDANGLRRRNNENLHRLRRPAAVRVLPPKTRRWLTYHSSAWAETTNTTAGVECFLIKAIAYGVPYGFGERGRWLFRRYSKTVRLCAGIRTHKQDRPVASSVLGAPESGLPLLDANMKTTPNAVPASKLIGSNTRGRGNDGRSGPMPVTRRARPRLAKRCRSVQQPRRRGHHLL